MFSSIRKQNLAQVHAVGVNKHAHSHGHVGVAKMLMGRRGV